METQTRAHDSRASTLGLGAVLVGSLPAALMTAEEPDRYTVEAVFSRRPEREEVTAILGRETRDVLTRAGYPTIEMSVSDRRLEISNTNLEELRDGLASVIADRLAEISDTVHAEQDAAVARFRVEADRAVERAAAVAALARTVTFVTSASTPQAAPAADRRGER